MFYNGGPRLPLIFKQRPSDVMDRRGRRCNDAARDAAMSITCDEADFRRRNNSTSFLGLIPGKECVGNVTTTWRVGINYRGFDAALQNPAGEWVRVTIDANFTVTDCMEMIAAVSLRGGPRLPR
jgi:hypothetical protein